MLVLEHKRQLVKACQPQSREEWEAFWADIKPIKYGNSVSWTLASPPNYILASYRVPREVYQIPLRVECYTVNFTALAPDFGMFEPPPIGTAFWQTTDLGPGTTIYTQTRTTAPTHLSLDADELLIFHGGVNLQLVGNFAASADGNTRTVRTLVYGYDVGPRIVERIGTSQVIEPLPG